MSGSWSKGSTPQWRRLRAHVLQQNQERNGGRCTLAVPGVCTGVANQVHHVLGRKVSGDDPAHLAAVCRACNLHVGDPSRVSPAHSSVTDWRSWSDQQPSNAEGY